MMIWTCKENSTKQTAMKNPRMGTRGNMKVRKTQQKKDEWSKIEYD